VSLSFDPIDEAGRNWTEHGWGSGSAMLAATSITRAHQILLARINTALSPFGLTFSRFEVLALLYFSREHQLPMGKIGSRLQVHPTSVTSLVNRLVKDDLVKRVEHPTDRRTTLVKLTNHGVHITPQCAAQLEEIEFGLDGLGEDEYRSITAMITPVREANADWTFETETQR
jgi:DNA-binding MarR family transcriptional regulator